ncbi:MAG: VWA domain-containing protein [Deltaproteobacteria bacterium]|nr:VWA domain-containing protein [Deltaproteobacteria bacterium]
MASIYRRTLITSLVILMVSGMFFFPEWAQAKFQPPMPPAPGEPENGKIYFGEPEWDTPIDLAGGKDEKLHFHVRGEYWSYRTTLGDTQEIQQQNIREWLSEIKCPVLADLPGHVVGRMDQETGEVMTYYFKISRSTTEAKVYLDRHVSVANEITMTIGGEGRQGFDFWMDHDGKTFQSLVVQFEKDRVNLYGISKSKVDGYERSYRKTKYCRIEHGARQTLFDIPQYAGPYKWRASTDSKTPQTIKISVISGPPLPELQDGSNLGAVRVRNLPFGSVQLKPEWEVWMGHPDFKESSLRADRTPEGDAIFWLPSGYWMVEGKPIRDEGLSSATAHLIPVHSGQITQVEWPRSLSGLFAPQGIGRLEILDARPRGDMGEVDVSLVELDQNIVPKVDRVNCYEGGLAGKIISVEPLKSPLNVVFLLDSSGSMKGAMSKALAATKTFVTLFPENAEITIVDFDTKQKKIEAADRQMLIKALDKVRADGATSLYDSMLLGLGLLKDKDRRALVVFTDGVDANWNDTGPGSKATKSEVMKAVETAKTPVFTIGFGKSPDVDTLTRVASLSGGTYYEAHDKETLDSVFAKISANLGRQYRVTYQRPQAAGLSDVPVMTIVVDNSGSMDHDPSLKGCGFRIQKVKEILKEFRQSLPKGFLVQLLTFNDDVRAGQVISAEPAPLLQGLAMMQAGGGTNILGSTAAALDVMKTVPSTRRYLVYLTDAAMKVAQKDQKEMDILLSSLNDEGIQCLFVGVVDTDEGGAFEHAAQLSGGRYVISTDLEKVKTVFGELADQIFTAPEKEKEISLRLTLADRDARGKNRLFSAGRFVDFPKLPVSDNIVSPEAVTWSIQGPLKIYDQLLGSAVSGGEHLGKSVSVAKRIPFGIKDNSIDMELGVQGSNDAMTLSISEMVILSRLRDIDPPRNHRFLVLPLQLTNILKPQKVAVYKDGSQHPAAWMAGSAAPVSYEEKTPPYLIPDLTRHLFLRWNEGITLPVSPATWLCEEPLLVPGERALSIPPNQSIKGACAFLVPDTEMAQASLHFYDVNYGHIDIPLTGVMPARPEAPADLPTRPEKNLGSSFALKISRVEDLTNIGQIPAGDGFVFRVIEGYLTSKIQALLALDPAQRFTYHLPTDKGDFVFTLHAATELVPMGFYRPTMVTPGSRNVIRMAFRMPKDMADRPEKGYLFVDVFGGGVRLELADAPAPASALSQPGASGQGIEIHVNQSGLVKERVADRRGNLVAVDITFKDAPDRSHTRLGHLVVLKKKGTGAADWGEYYQRHHAGLQKIADKPHRGLGSFGKVGLGGEELLKETGASLAIPLERMVIFGMDEKSVIFDGQTRRGVMLFELPRDEKIEDWVISSWILDDIALPIHNAPFAGAVLFSERLVLNDKLDNGFWQKLEKKVAELQAQRVAKGYERPGSVSARPVDLDTADLGKQPVPAPGISSPGAQKLKQVTRSKDIWKTIAELRWRPGQPIAWRPHYAPEAVLTQGWGDPSDLAALAERLLNQQGVVTTRITVIPTEAGKHALAEMIHAQKMKIESLPALLFSESGGKETLMVLPWCKAIEELEGLVTWDGVKKESQDWPQKIRLQIKLEVEPTASQQGSANTRVAASALAGGSNVGKRKWITLFDQSLLGEDLSLDALDIGYTETRKEGHPVLQVVVDGPSGRQVGSQVVELDQYTVSNEWLGTHMDNGPWRIAQEPVDENHPITGRFHVLSINAPDLYMTDVKELEAVRQKKYAQADTPDGLSALRWYGRTVINRFVAAQTRFEKDLAKKLDLTIGRSLNGRCLLLTVQRADKNAAPSTRMDLLHVANDIHGGKAPDFNKAVRAFNIMSGFAAAQFEAAAIPGGGMGLFELWTHSPEGTQLAYIDHHNKRAFTDMLKEKGYPETLVKYLYDCRSAILFPSNPAIINETARWGWLEIDPKTYNVVSRLDNGAAGAMVEGIIGNLFQQATSYLVGALVGIDVSLWSVSAYSLQLEDYDQICEKAYGFASGFSKKFSVSEEITGPVGWDIGGSPDVELAKFDRFIKFSLDFGGIKASNNMLGFKNGYKDAVEYYFSD